MANVAVLAKAAEKATVHPGLKSVRANQLEWAQDCILGRHEARSSPARDG